MVDQAGLLSADAERALDERLAGHERASQNQVVVVTVDSLQGRTIEEFGYQLGRHWGIGQAEQDNGVLLIVAPQERRVRIEVGYGLEGLLTDAISSNIIHSLILPAFRRGDVEGGIAGGALAVVDALGGQYQMRGGVQGKRLQGPARYVGLVRGWLRRRWLRRRRRRRVRGRRRLGRLVGMLIDDAGAEKIAERIAAIERETDAELVTVLARQSDDYTFIPTLWAALAALATPWLLYLGPFFGAFWLETSDLLIAQGGVFVALFALLRWPPVLRRVVPRAVRVWRASSLAKRQFLEQGLHHTRGETGVLIFVSEAEHYVEILADRGIDVHVGHDGWQHIIDAFTTRLHDGQVLDGFLDCIDACGALLVEYAPATGEKNELPNHLVRL